METWTRLTVTRGEVGGGQWWTEGEGIRQRTCMNDPWTWTTVGIDCGRGVRWEEEDKGEKNWDSYNRITIKKW